MAGSHSFVVILLLLGMLPLMAEGLGVNWGVQATHRLPPKTVVRMIQDNGINKVKLFDADEAIMSALAGTGIEVMVGIPNDQLASMTNYDSAKDWVAKNVSRYLFNGGVDIKYVAVGNEPLLTTYNGLFLSVTFPALQNIQNALTASGSGNIKATVPLNADVYESTSGAPSTGKFRDDVSALMTQIVQFLNQSGAPFTVNIYPFLGLYLDKNFPVDYAFFDGTTHPVADGGIQYTNMFDANFDTLVSALKGVGLGNMAVIVGEVGWPTDGDINAKAVFAEKFYNGLLRHLANDSGTPLRPKQHIEVYLFSLIDEDAKSVAPGGFERHWGIFRYDGQPKFPMDLSGQGRSRALAGAKGVKYLPRRWCVLNPSAATDLRRLGDGVTYACQKSDCTSLGYGSSCNDLDASGNASYAFNMYFQDQDQVDGSCDFGGLATVTAQNASRGGCDFIVQIDTEAMSSSSTASPTILAMLFLSAIAIFWGALV